MQVASSGKQEQMLTKSIADHVIWILLDLSLPHFGICLPQLCFAFAPSDQDLWLSFEALQATGA